MYHTKAVKLWTLTNDGVLVGHSFPEKTDLPVQIHFRSDTNLKPQLLSPKASTVNFGAGNGGTRGAFARRIHSGLSPSQPTPETLQPEL